MKIIVSLLFVFLGFTVCGCRQSQPAESKSSSKPMIKFDFGNTGTVTGTVSFTGAQLKTSMIDMTADPACPQTPQSSDAVVIDHGKLANVFVYVKSGLPKGNYGVPTEPVVLDQKGCRYQPHILGIVAGQPLKIINSDPADHNVHAMPNSNPQWNESQAADDPPIVKSFAKPEMRVAVQCNQHPWMRAYINVMGNDYFAVSAPDGKFEIKDLAPGEYTIAAVHEKFGEQTAHVKVEPKQNTKLDFTFHPAQ